MMGSNLEPSMFDPRIPPGGKGYMPIDPNTGEWVCTDGRRIMPPDTDDAAAKKKKFSCTQKVVLCIPEGSATKDSSMVSKCPVPYVCSREPDSSRI